MLKNYLVTAVHNLLKNKLYSFINIIGLAIGLAACIAIFLYVDSELSYDKHWEKSDQLYRLNVEYHFPGSTSRKNAYIASPVLTALKSYFPAEIEAGTRISRVSTSILVNGRVVKQDIMGVDEDFTHLFQPELIAGSLTATLAGTSNIALSVDSSKRIFGENDPIGKTISVPARFGLPAQDYIVTAIYRFPTENTVVKADAIALINDTMRQAVPRFNSWTFTIGGKTWIRLADGVSLERMNEKLAEFTNQRAVIPDRLTSDGSQASSALRYHLQPITDIYLNPWADSDKDNAGNNTSIVIFSIVAVLILGIACINFSTLSAAKSLYRSKEVGIRKALGARKTHVLLQYLGESLLQSFFAVLLGLVFIELITPLITSLIGKQLSLDYSNPMTYAMLLSLVAVAGIVSSWYPAVIMSGFRPSNALRNRLTALPPETFGKGTVLLIQFSVSIILLIATVLVFLQWRHASNNNLGFNPHNVVVVSLSDSQADVEKNRIFKQEVDKLGNVISSSRSFSRPGQRITGPALDQEVKLVPSGQSAPHEVNEPMRLNMNLVDGEFFATYELPIVAGRGFGLQDRAIDFTMGQSSTPQNLTGTILINEAAVSALGIRSSQDAIGRIVQTSFDLLRGEILADFIVVGVVANSHFDSLRQEIKPEVYRYDPEEAFNLSIKFSGSRSALVSSISEIWPLIMNDAYLNITPAEEMLDSQIDDIQNQNVILGMFSLLTVILSCLGLLGMTSFDIERRTKELGLRKLMGARVANIMKLLFWQFSKPVLVANIVAFPIVAYAMASWLENFPNRIDSLWLIPLCLATGIVSVILVATTIVGSTFKIAKQSPIIALRHE